MVYSRAIIIYYINKIQEVLNIENKTDQQIL